MLFDNPLPKNLIFKKSFLHALAVLGYLPKSKMAGIAKDKLLVHIFCVLFL